MSSEAPHATLAAEALRRGARGDLRAMDAALEALRAARGPEALACALRLRALYTTMAPDRARPPTLDELRALDASSEPVRRLADETCAEMTTQALLAFDPVALEAWRGAIRDADGLPALRAEARSAWLGGRRDALEVTAEALLEAASAARDAAATVEAHLLRALAALEADRAEDALASARRASRMARTEELLEQEYLANLVLARARRFTGAPHLASTILEALAVVVPAPFRGWLAWERALVAGVAPTGAPSVAAHLGHLLAAAEAGDLEGFRDAAAVAAVALEGRAPLIREVERLRGAVDPDAVVEGDAPLARWRRGEDPKLPLRFGCEPGAAVLVRPGARSRRVLTVGAALAHGPTVEGQARTLGCLAALALAGDDGLAAAELFEGLYGFGYDAAKHAGTMQTLLRRAGAALEGHGELCRDGERVRLEVARPIAIPDPRCVPELDEQVLIELARGRGRLAARDVADALKVSLRTVQSALRRLGEEGACRKETDGGRVCYAVEDTTFSEPTLHRLIPTLRA
ncbi:MAG: winged helix-turn-helix domain-containing protein [Sandaracinaceae bacterium]